MSKHVVVLYEFQFFNFLTELIENPVLKLVAVTHFLERESSFYTIEKLNLPFLDKTGECFWTRFESIFQMTPLGKKVLKHLADKYEDRKINMLYLEDFIHLRLHPLDNDEYEVCVLSIQ